jgi:FdhD protein
LPVAENARAQTAPALEKFFRAGRNGAIHPVTGPAFLRAVKSNSLNFKILADQFVKIDIARDDVSSNQRRRTILDFERAAEFIENFQREKSDLALVIILKIEVAIALNAAPGYTFDQRNFDHRILIGFAAMVPDKIVAPRNVKVTDFHQSHDTIAAKPFHMKEPGIGSEKIIRRKRDGELEYQPDDLTIEEPLEIRIGRKSLATTMRTPGHDDELAAGFLVSEAIVRGRKEISEISGTRENIVVVELAAGVKLKLGSAKRFGTISSSCGICGKNSIAAIRQDFPPIESARDVRIVTERLMSLPELLRKHQGDFARTGGIHAAGIFDLNGEPKVVREDIGRHNAVDKVIGRAFLDGLLPLDRHVLLVSGRASFEIMQKALSAGIPIVASVSAPSTLAMNFARESNQTLVGFLRPPSFNVYAHVERVILEER